MLPLYIWRGSYHGDITTARQGEDMIMTATGLCVGFLLLLLMQSRRKDTLYRGKQEICIDAAGGVAIYMTAWVVMHLCTRNNYLFAFCGYHLAYMLGVDEKNQPQTWASLVATLIYAAVYFTALLLGSKLAHRRTKRVFEKLQATEEL